MSSQVDEVLETWESPGEANRGGWGDSGEVEPKSRLYNILAAPEEVHGRRPALVKVKRLVFAT
jgi:hypothetical protein